MERRAEEGVAWAASIGGLSDHRLDERCLILEYRQK